MVRTNKRLVGMLVLVAWFVLMFQAQAKSNSDHDIYLPFIANPLLTVADFDTCSKTNNLGGEMGASYNPSTSDWLIESYEPEVGRGCIARLNYHIPTAWSAFWLKLVHTNLTQYESLSFDIKFTGDIDPNTDMEIKVELKRGCHDGLCSEVWIQYIPDITNDWQKMTINLADFYSSPDGLPPPPLTDMEELIFTFEKGHISSEGSICLDNIVFGPK